MKIKYLELNNFKSFKGRTIVPFKFGLTLITGPNGAGKSNIINAINFALGKYEARAKHLIHEGEKEASVRIVLEYKNEDLLSISRTIDVNGDESLNINGKQANNNDIPYNDFNFVLLDSNSHNQLDACKLKDFIKNLKEDSNKKQVILVSAQNDLSVYADQIIAVSNKIKNQSELKEMQPI